MLSANNLKTAMIMCKRASCTGEESLEVAQTILAIESDLRAAMEAEQVAAQVEAELAEKKAASDVRKAAAAEKRNSKGKK